MFDQLYRLLEKSAFLLLVLGGFMVLIQAVWISYGVIMRYIFRSPDGMVTEATALMLMPIAFLGLAYALKKDAYPKVMLFVERLPLELQRIVERLNYLIMTSIGFFLFTASFKAVLKNFKSGAASEILLWPKVIFWVPVSLSLLVFALYALLLFLKPSKREVH